MCCISNQPRYYFRKDTLLLHTEYEVITSWGFADDILLTVILPDGEKQFVDFSIADARIVAKELIKAADYAEELQTGYFDAELGYLILETLLERHDNARRNGQTII